MDDKPMITITDAAGSADKITLSVEGGQSMTVSSDPATVADAIRQINESN